MKRTHSLFLGLAVLVLVAPLLAGCAFQCPPVEEPTGGGGGGEVIKTQTGGGPVDMSGLESKIKDLERRLAENEKLADQANTTAEKALKCCRKDYTILMTEEIYFDFNRSDIRTEDFAKLDRIAEKLKADPDLIAEMGGFTDSVGTADYNIVLGQKRADAARSYLVGKHNINYGRLAIRTFGREAAANAPGADVNKRLKDRRVTIDVLGYAQ
jgi:outer membrane protein OmpA-like peptidoglycan-associated protein